MKITGGFSRCGNIRDIAYNSKNEKSSNYVVNPVAKSDFQKSTVAFSGLYALALIGQANVAIQPQKAPNAKAMAFEQVCKLNFKGNGSKNYIHGLDEDEIMAMYDAEELSIQDLQKMNIQTNSSISKADFEKAQKIMKNIYAKTTEGVKNGKGPFYAEIYDDKGNLVSAASNSVVEDNCSMHHAEVNALRKAHAALKKYDLAPNNLTIYVNAEPCIMCTGAIMWSGVKTVYYGVPSKDVEEITGFDEGYKPDWINEFKKRGITVYGNIEPEQGKQVLKDYVTSGKEIYKPTRE